MAAALAAEPAENADRPDNATPTPWHFPSAPEPASEEEIDMLRYELRAARHELRHHEGLLAGLHQARERARDEWRVAQVAVAEAAQTLTEVRKHSRAHLVEAYVNYQPIDAAMTEADAKAQLDLRADQLRHVEEIEAGIRVEIADIENNMLLEHQRRRDKAAGNLVSRTPQFLGLVTRIQEAFAILRDVRLTVAEMRRMVMLDDTLCRMIEANQPSGAGRWGGYDTDDLPVAGSRTGIRVPPVRRPRGALAVPWISQIFKTGKTR